MRYEYEYTDGAGGTFEIDAPMEQAPAWGLTYHGRPAQRLVRLQSRQKSRTKIARTPKGDRMGNRSLCKGWPFAKKFDSENRPVFDTKQEQVEAEARAAAAGEFARPLELSQPGDLPTTMRADE